MPASNMIERVSELIEQGIAVAPEPTRSDLERLLRRLREPVRVAVVGRVNAGKSTMVNALLGQRVAPTDVSECTRLVTWFRYGHPQRVEVELFDGTTIETQLTPAGTLPDRLEAPVEKIRALHCYLANETLQWVTLIDTPGIGSVHGQFSSATETLLSAESSSADAAQRADAVVFLFNQVMMEDELEALHLFRAGSELEASQSAANAVGVLSKADQLGDGAQDPWGVALELADRYAAKFRDEVAAVVPVIGLVAETAETASLKETDCKDLDALAAMDEKAFKRLLWSADRFVTAEAPVSPEARERLLAMLDLYGVGRAVTLIRGGTTGAGAVRKDLSSISGIAEVKRTLAKYFRDQDHVLKVRSVLELLRRLSFTAGSDASSAMARFRADVEALKLDPDMHPVAELEAMHDCLMGRVQLPSETLAELSRLFSPGSASYKLGVSGDAKEDLSRAAQEGMARWRTSMVSEADPARAKVARTVLRSYQILWKGVQ